MWFFTCSSVSNGLRLVVITLSVVPIEAGNTFKVDLQQFVKDSFKVISNTNNIVGSHVSVVNLLIQLRFF